MSWKHVVNRCRGRRYVGLTVWFRRSHGRNIGKGHACLTNEVVEWLGSERASIHVDDERCLLAIAPSDSITDGKVCTYVGKQSFLAATDLLMTRDYLLGSTYQLKPANEPGLGRCLICHIPPPESAPAPRATPQTRHDGREAIREMVNIALSLGQPVNSSVARALGATHGLTSAEVQQAITRYIDEYREANPRPKGHA